MSRFRCEDCGCEFEDDEFVTIREPHGEEWSGCPNCHSTDWVKGKDCEVCGEITYNSHGFCDDCMREAKKLIKDDFEHMPPAHFSNLIELFTYAIDELYTEERKKEWSSEH